MPSEFGQQIANKARNSNNGEIKFEDMVADLDYRQKRRLAREMNNLKTEGLIEKFIRRNPDTGEWEHIVRFVGEGQTPVVPPRGELGRPTNAGGGNNG